MILKILFILSEIVAIQKNETIHVIFTYRWGFIMKHLLNTFLEISLYSSVIIIFTTLLDKFTRKYYSSRWTYYIWLILAIRMLLPFNLGLIKVPDILPVTKQASIQKETPASTGNSTIVIPANGMVAKESELQSNKSSSFQKDDLPDETLPNEVQEDIKYHPFQINHVYKVILSTIPYIWFIGIVFYMLRHIITYVLFLNKIKRWSIATIEEETLQILADTILELHIQKPIKIETCNYVFSPMMIGFLHPKIILPSDNYSGSQLRTIIKHELIHYKHKDICYKFLLLCVNAIHWFNPFVYYMVNSANQTMELYCDESVIAKQDKEYRQNYSYALLRTIEKQQQKQQKAFSTYFNGGKKLMKERFVKIMNNSPKKKGILFFTIVFSLIVLTWFVAADSINNNEKSTANNSGKASAKFNPTTKDTQNEDNKKSTEVQTDTILLVGIDGSNKELFYADSIMLVTIQPQSKELTLTSFLRDMYVKLPNGTKNKLNAAYTQGGIKLLKETLEYNFELTIDSTVEINYPGFENIINLLGGAKVTLTEKEATYLNRTNYISKPENRNVSKGEQTLNGNQALGYVRIRHVANSNGINGDMGRTERQRNLLLSLYNNIKSTDPTTLIPVADSVLDNVTTNLKKDRIVFYLNTLLEPAYTIRTMQIPVEGSYQTANKNGMLVLDFEITENKNELHKLMQP